MINFIEIPEKRRVVAELRNCRYDALNKIAKMIDGTGLTVGDTKKYIMPDRFSTYVTCHPEDEYSFEEGKKIARRKLLDHYYASLDKRLKKFENSLTECFKTFKKAIDK